MFELLALLAFDKEFSNFRTPLHVLRLHFPDFSLLSSTLGFGMRRAEGILRPLPPMILQCLFCLCMPNLTFVMGHILPRKANYLGKRAMVSFHSCRYMLAFDEG